MNTLCLPSLAEDLFLELLEEVAHDSMLLFFPSAFGPDASERTNLASNIWEYLEVYVSSQRLYQEYVDLPVLLVLGC